jgi:hypothetical protein
VRGLDAGVPAAHDEDLVFHRADFLTVEPA